MVNLKREVGGTSGHLVKRDNLTGMLGSRGDTIIIMAGFDSRHN